MTTVNLDKITVREATLLVTGEKDFEVAQKKVHEFGKMIDPKETNDQMIFFNGLISLIEDWRLE